MKEALVVRRRCSICKIENTDQLCQPKALVTISRKYIKETKNSRHVEVYIYVYPIIKNFTCPPSQKLPCADEVFLTE